MNQNRDMTWNGVAIITGASSGIGAAIAQKLASNAKGVIIAARRCERLEKLAKSLGKHVIPLACDVSDKKQVQKLADEAISRFGQIDAIINNAGIFPMSSMTRCHVEDWEKAIDVNIKGVLYGIAAVLPHMLNQKTGHIINISSTAGRRIFAGAAVYCGTKHAVHAIGEGLQLDLSERSQKDENTIKVTTITPGLVQTELPNSVTHESARLNFQKTIDHFDGPLQPHDIAEGVAFALNTPDHVEIGEVLIRPTKQLF